MDISGIDYLCFRYSLERGTGEILEEDDELLFIYDGYLDEYLLACDDKDKAIRVLEKYKDRDYRLLMTTNRDAVYYARDRFGLVNIEECYQFAYLGELPHEDERISFRKAVLSDLKTIMAVYDGLDEEDMTRNIERGVVRMAYEGEELVGFMGEHLDGSQGMLYVYPEHRRKGYATALEHALFAEAIRNGRIPFGQVIAGNTASMELQKRNGLTMADRMVFWAWRGKDMA